MGHFLSEFWMDDWRSTAAECATIPEARDIPIAVSSKVWHAMVRWTTGHSQFD
jgi:hypothetical protein